MPQVQVIQPIQQQPKRLRVAAYARDAMAGADGNGLIRGLPDHKTAYLDPGGSTTRAQVATILMRYKQATA